MSSRRTLILIGAIAVGVIAAFLLYNYVQGIENKADEDAVLVDVYSAQGDIPRGTTGQQVAADGTVATSKIPQEFRPATAITTLDEIQKKVALFDIAANTVIVQGMFVDPAQQQISFRARLKNPDHVAITVSADGVRAVAGFLVPGDSVNIMVASQAAAPAEGEAPEGDTGFLPSKMRYLYQEVEILAVGTNVLLAPGETVPADQAAASGGGLITFNVPPDAALWIATANEAGIYLSLVAEDYTPRAIPALPATIGDLPGEDPSVLTPYGPEGNQG